MNLPIDPLRVQSLKQACIARLEELILSGEWQAGEKLPAERELAAQLGLSRPLLHEALVDLAAKGLVTIAPRHGVSVNDFRKSGSTAILSSLLTYHEGRLDPQFVQSLFAMRLLVEQETASLAARAATPEQLAGLHALLEAEMWVDPDNRAALTNLDFEFHLLVAIASGNQVYPLIINSFKNVYTHFTGLFFERYRRSPVIGEVFAFHGRLVEAVAAHDSPAAAAIMREMLEQGEKLLNDESRE